MSLVLSEEERILKKSAKDFFEQKRPLEILRELRSQPTEGFDKTMWMEMSELGWTGILVPQEYGGTDFGLRGLGLILEEGGRRLVSSPLISSSLICVKLISELGTSRQKDEHLPALSSGELVVSLAVDESGKHDLLNIKSTLEEVNGRLILNGEKHFVVDGQKADKFIIIAKSSQPENGSKGIALLLIDSKTRGLSIDPLNMVDGRAGARLKFSNLLIERENILGGNKDAFDAVLDALDGANAALSAEMLGMGLEIFDRTLTYLKERKQFDRFIGSFQSLKHRCAAMFTEIELTKSIVLEALTALEEKRGDSAELSSAAKVMACDMLELVSNEGVQMHGGIGMTDLHDIGLFLKRARVASQLFGDSLYHRSRYCEQRNL